MFLTSAILHRTKEFWKNTSIDHIFSSPLKLNVLTTHIHISYTFYNITTVILNRQTFFFKGYPESQLIGQFENVYKRI